ncbi:hypothetical protein Leryth_012002, partial [Lithospermum erythrorhizon]
SHLARGIHPKCLQWKILHYKPLRHLLKMMNGHNSVRLRTKLDGLLDDLVLFSKGS